MSAAETAGRTTDDASTAGRSTVARVAGWFTPAIALARIAWLRTILYLFVILDMHAFVRDTRDKGEHPGLYQRSDERRVGKECCSQGRCRWGAGE